MEESGVNHRRLKEPVVLTGPQQAGIASWLKRSRAELERLTVKEVAARASIIAGRKVSDSQIRRLSRDWNIAWLRKRAQRERAPETEQKEPKSIHRLEWKVTQLIIATKEIQHALKLQQSPALRSLSENIHELYESRRLMDIEAKMLAVFEVAFEAALAVQLLYDALGEPIPARMVRASEAIDAVATEAGFKPGGEHGHETD